DVSVQVRPIVGATYALIFDSSLGDSTVTGQLATAASAGDTAIAVTSTFVGPGRLLINGDEYDFTAFAAGVITLAPSVALRRAYPVNAVVRQLRRAALPGTTVNVWGAQALY